MNEPIRSLQLENGLLLRFYDLSNRYFGDYHRVCVKVAGEIPLARLSIPPDLMSLQKRLPETLVYGQELTRMGVAGADLEATCARLIDDFMANSGPYLASSAFPERLLRKTLQEQVSAFSLSPSRD